MTNAPRKSLQSLPEGRPFAVVESFLQGKRDEASNEDGLCLTPWFAAVADGATAKTDFRLLGKTPGRMGMELVLEAIRALPPDAAAPDALALITAHMARFCEQHHLTAHTAQHPECRPTASAAIFSRFRQEVWLVGDCQCLADGRWHRCEKPSDRILADARALMLEMELAAGKTLDELRRHDTGRDFILPALRRQTLLQNRSDAPLGYAVFDGTPVRLDRVAVVPAEGVTRLVLASDGYPELLPTLAQTEQALQRTLADDPLCFRTFRSTKGWQPEHSSFDDRAYLSLRLG